MSARPVADREHLIHRSANRLWGQLAHGCGKPLKDWKNKGSQRFDRVIIRIWLLFDQVFAGLVLQGLQERANILSTDAPTEIGGNFGRQPGEKVCENRDLDWSIFVRRPAGLDFRGVA
jgi:hypothetical protein